MKTSSNKLKYFLLILILAITATLLLWPNFHPERKVLGGYYWQADVFIHSGYFFGLTFLIALLKFKIKPLSLFVLLGLFSIAMELLQHFSYKRGVSLMDASDNLIGIALGLIVYHLMQERGIRSL